MPLVSGVIVTLVEFLGGMRLIVGLLTRWAAALNAFDMVVAILVVHLKNGFLEPGGYEHPLIMLAACIALVMLGPGSVSVDGAAGEKAGIAGGGSDLKRISDHLDTAEDFRSRDSMSLRFRPKPAETGQSAHTWPAVPHLWRFIFLRHRLNRALAAEYAGENLVDISQLTFQIKRALYLLAWNPAGDAFIFQLPDRENSILFPGPHGVALHRVVGDLARDAVFHQIEQQLPAEHQSARAFQIGFHVFRIDEHSLEQVRGLL